MLNIEKIKSMTKAATFENGPEKKNIKISEYFREDYISLQMLKSGVAYTVAFCILAGIWALSTMEELMLMISHEDYVKSLLELILTLFAGGLIIYEGAVYAYYSIKYKNAKQSLKGYYSNLKEIHKFYETEMSAEIGAEQEKTL